MFGSYDDREELLIQFTNLCLQQKESSSAYLKRLYLELQLISDLSPMRSQGKTLVLELSF